MNTANFITKNIEGVTVRYDKDTGFICASDMCKIKKGREWYTYIRSKHAKEFIALFDKNEVIQSNRGGSNPGTWVRQDIAIHLAMWISPKCGIAVINIVSRFIDGDLSLANELVENKNEIDGNLHTLEVATNPQDGQVISLAEAYDPDDKKSMDVLQEKYNALEIRCKEAEARADRYFQQGQEAAEHFECEKQKLIADKHSYINDAMVMRKKINSMPKKNSFYNRDYVREAFEAVMLEGKAKPVYVYLIWKGQETEAYESEEDFKQYAEDPTSIENLEGHYKLTFAKLKPSPFQVYHSTLYIRKSRIDNYKSHPIIGESTLIWDYYNIAHTVYDVNCEIDSY